MEPLNDTLTIASSGQQTFIPMWVPWAIIGAQAIAIGFLIKKKNRQGQAFADLDKDSVSNRTQPIDMANVIESMYGAEPLYKKLSRQCHPDRFVNSALADKANEIFQEVSRHRRNLAELRRLEKVAEHELKTDEQ